MHEVEKRLWNKKGKRKSNHYFDYVCSVFQLFLPFYANPCYALAQVWQPGVDGVDEDEQLQFDPTAYDCLHAFSLGWPCLR